MCAALGRACGGSPAWALGLLRGHPGTFDSFWRDSFGGAAGTPGACDIDEILGRS